MKVSKLSIIVPALNEVATVDDIYKRLSKLKLGVPYEVIFVDDGSTDGTTEYLRKLKRKKPREFTFLFHKNKQGKGTAIRTALSRVSGSHVAIQDADNEYDPQELRKLIVEANKHRLGVVFGSRNKEIKNKYLYPLYYWGAKVLSALINILFKQNLTDPVTCSKLIPAALFRFIQITEHGFGIEIEIACKIGGLGISISEVSISYTPRTFAEGKKIRTKDGLYSLYLILKYKLNDVHYGVVDRILRRMREDKVLSHIQLTNKTVLVDVGCGRQAYLGWRLRSKVLKYIGVDAQVQNISIDTINLLQHDVDKLSPSQVGKMVDMIMSCAVIEHLKDPQRFINISKQMLKKGGLLCITTPHPSTHTFLHGISRVHIIDPKEIHEHRYYFTVEDLKSLLEYYGFRIIVAEKFLFGMNGLVIGKKYERITKKGNNIA